MTGATIAPVNPVLADLDDDTMWSGETMDERIAATLDYLTDGFGRIARNDGIYAPEEIADAMPQLERIAVQR